MPLSDHNNENGDYTTHLYCIDSLGNLFLLTGITIHVDRTIPTVGHSLSTSAWTNGNVTINVSASDNGDIWKIVDQSSNSVLSESWAYSVSNNGTYSFTAYDDAGNASAKDTVVISNIDKTAPSVSLTANGHTTAATATNSATGVTVTASASDSASGINTSSYQYKC